MYVINMIVYLNISFDVVQFTVHNFCHVHHVHETFKVLFGCYSQIQL